MNEFADKKWNDYTVKDGRRSFFRQWFDEAGKVKDEFRPLGSSGGALIPPSEPASPVDMTLGPTEKPRSTAEATNPNDDGWLSGDAAKVRFQKTPEFLQKVVLAEREKHNVCSTDTKLLRIDVVRDVGDSTTYLDINCAGCGKYRKLRVGERTASIDVMIDTVTPTKPPEAPSAKDRLLQLERDRESARLRNAEAAEARRWNTRDQILRNKAEISIPKEWLDKSWAASAIPYDQNAAERLLRGVVEKDKFVRNPPAIKKIEKPKVDRLTLERAAPAADDEV